MDDDGSNLVFDFEGTLKACSDSVVVGSASNALGPATVGLQHDQGRGSGSFQQVVCRHWLRGLCMKGESCGYLHQYDQDRLPVCHFFRAYGCCRVQDCIFKHNAEDVKECSMYNMGFCPNGPGCQYMHVKKPGPPPPVEEVVKKLQQMNSLYYGSSSGIYQPSDNNNNQHEKPPVQHGSVLKNQNLVAHATPIMQQRAAHHVQTAHPQHVPSPHIQQQQQQHAQVQGVPDGSSNQATITASPLPQGQSRYSIVKSCNRENLEKSVLQGVWASNKGVMMSF
uniref:Uncharacterized protein n=4 Tax=Avena sativa TaxID=4498 RepID=A0ACD5YNH4_AVESA